MYTVAELMTRRVLTLEPDDDLALADAILKFDQIRHLPVLDRGRVVGVVSQRDVLRAVSNLPGAAGSFRAREVMTSPVRTVSPGLSLRRAAETMVDQKIGCLPVVDGGGTLVGILTESDLVRLAVELMEELDTIAVSGPSGEQHA